jgi:uncharacterized protein
MDTPYGSPMERSEADLGPAACWELLATTSVGRLALSVRALPTIVPVRYAVEGGSVAISVGRLGPPAAVHDAVVAFAADRIDEESASGWMVQMQGRARLAPAGLPASGVGAGAAGQVVLLVPATVTGHRFVLPPSTAVP